MHAQAGHRSIESTRIYVHIGDHGSRRVRPGHGRHANGKTLRGKISSAANGSSRASGIGSTKTQDDPPSPAAPVYLGLCA